MGEMNMRVFYVPLGGSVNGFASCFILIFPYGDGIALKQERSRKRASY